MNEYPIKGFLISDVSNAWLLDTDFRGGDSFSFSGRRSNVAGAKLSVQDINYKFGHGEVMNFCGIDGAPSGINPLGQAASQTGATIADILLAYNKSGSKQPILVWVQQPEVIKMFQDLAKSGQTVAEIYNNGGSLPIPSKTDSTPPPPPADIKVWGLTPLQLGLGALGLIVVVTGSILAVKYFKTPKVA